MASRKRPAPEPEAAKEPGKFGIMYTEGGEVQKLTFNSEAARNSRYSRLVTAGFNPEKSDE